MSWYLRSAVLVLFVRGLRLAQAERLPVPSHQDPVVQGVQDHINAALRAHDARLASVRDEAGLVRELDQARGRFLGLLDLDLDRPRPEPRATRVGTVDGEGYRIEKIVVESAPGSRSPATSTCPSADDRRSTPAGLALSARPQWAGSARLPERVPAARQGRFHRPGQGRLGQAGAARDRSWRGGRSARARRGPN